MIKTQERQRIRRMHAEGLSITAIAKEVGISRTTVYAYLQDQERGLRTSRRGPVSKLFHADQEKLVEAYTALGGNATALAQLLRSSPEVFGLEKEFVMSDRSVLRFMTTRYPDLGKPKKPAYQAFVCEPGQQLQIDFTFGEFRFAGQAKPTKLSFFEAVYPWSHKAFVMVLPGTVQSSWMMGISTCLARLGCPAEILCDNDKSLVIHNRGTGNVRFHPDFEWLLRPFGIKPVACRPSRPQTKGSVERFGRYFKENCLLRLQYLNRNIRNIKELQSEIDQWIVDIADTRTFGGKTVAQWFEEERGFLAIPGHADTYMPVAHRIEVASRRAAVHLYGQRFQLPPECAGTWVAITVRLNGEFLISTMEGRELLTGAIPVDQMQTYKFDSKAVTADTAPAFELEQPNRVSHHMQDLVGIERYTNG